MAQAHLPPFGNWESGDVPYTQYFNDAGKKRSTGSSINSKDLNQNAEPYMNNAQPAPMPAPRAEHGNPKPKDGPPSVRRQETDSRRPTGTSLRHDQQNKGQGNNATPERRSNRMSVNQSPLHPVHQSKPTYRGGSNPPAERRSSDKHAPNTPGRSGKKHGGRGNETQPEQDLAVPPFGEWDDKDAESGDKYTGIFNRLREDRASPTVPGRSPHTTGREMNKNSEVKRCSCFSCFGM